MKDKDAFKKEWRWLSTSGWSPINVGGSAMAHGSQLINVLHAQFRSWTINKKFRFDENMSEVRLENAYIFWNKSHYFYDFFSQQRSLPVDDNFGELAQNSGRSSLHQSWINRTIASMTVSISARRMMLDFLSRQKFAFFAERKEIL